MHRRRRRFLAVAAFVTVPVATAWLGGGPAAPGAPAAPAAGPVAAAGAPSVASASAAEDEPVADPAAGATPLVARYADVPVHLPSASPLVVGFHEAATVSALDVTPAGRLIEDRNTTRTRLPDDEPGADYLVLTSRGRSAGPTSAIDIVLEEGDQVLAPVTGIVVDVRSYLLYGSHRDLRIEIVPDGRPDVRVVAIHLDGAAVAAGDRVVGGVSPIAASARRFSFGSHIDRETEPERFPHVHLEFQPVDGARPDATAAPGDG